ncbi:eye-specific diacylglycerol kinase isoform X8 [Sitodiplosis mosellana]|uniref:eye-specific diacylglycerol kinase isoform X8 n=1 Tax=Sitodiplosis mosellana TaxID=263140 RepID=UPI0024441C8E|nr:eye-specific diacylglycerol kinase isoform X8 [Sitodiplosis mosellana]XP_055301131.1 eye-specific diacylglycerol kinase isoform X8 [Sitodiplosis mosellana]XP_055301132.1 eye-specific diacylglycerol kinase isoform X8 [Sitodiplosis mosellana]
MNRIRTTFTRSRTPTGAEMKMQSSLEVPRQVRSTSFDEFQLEANRTAKNLIDHQQHSTDESTAALLQVPQFLFGTQRSRSVESGSIDSSVASYLEVPKRFQRRRSSNTKSPVQCVHCMYIEEYERWLEGGGSGAGSASDKSKDNEDHSTSDTSISDDDDTDESERIENSYKNHLTIPTLIPPPQQQQPCNIKFSLSPTDASFPLQSAHDEQPPVSSPPIETLCDIQPVPAIDIEFPAQLPNRGRRRSISRQEAIFIEPTGSSLENLDSVKSPTETEPKKILTNNEKLSTSGDSSDYVQDYFLAVPEADLRRDRAASVDSSFSKLSSNGKTEELQPQIDGFLAVPTNAVRSRSVDIVLPTNEQARYKALALAGPSMSKRNGTRKISQVPDWSDSAQASDHLWQPTSISGDFCYVGESECSRHGPRMKCSACKMVAHTSCISIIMNRTQLSCKPSFKDVSIRQYGEKRTNHHHWIHRRTEKGKCKQCGKSIQAKLSFSSKEIVAISCAWCKLSFHNKESCFNPERIGEECSLGEHSNIIVPPSWIIKLPRKGSFKSSLRKTSRKKEVSKKKSKEKESKAFVIKPVPTTKVTPVLVFINPKSGGNQGVKLLQKFQWLLNPRQVFDLTQGGPKMGLELFRKVPQLRILACGGDGTAGWILSVLDQMHFETQPAVGVLPLGTGNDLARALGWGGGYTDEPISTILKNIGDSDTILLDRWSLKVTPNPNAKDDKKRDGKDNLPLNVVNNYFSFGVDAHIALEFHEAREAHPERFNSRLRNKMFYGQAGGKDLLKRKWKDLSEMVILECDGKDITPKLKEHRVHAIVFLNIPSYGGGTRPWASSGGKQATDDGLIEVVGLTTYQLPMLQAGKHGTCIAQCKTAKIVTSKTIPMQVDGEAAKLKPSIIELSLLNKALMLAKRKPGRVNVLQTSNEPIPITINKISMTDYETHHYDKDLLRQSATFFATIKLNTMTDLEQIRKAVESYCEENANTPKLLPDWCFLDSCTAERFFRIDRAQEHLHYLTDIATETMYILDQELMTLPQTPDDEVAMPSGMPSKRSNNFSSGSSDNLERESHENTPTSPFANQTFFNRLSAAAPGSNSDSGMDSRKYSQDSQNSQNSPKQSDDKDDLADPNVSFDRMVNFKSNLLEKTTDAVIKSAKTGNFIMLRDLHMQGYSLLSIDATGQTALHYACKYGYKDIVKYLISYAPNSIINMVDNTTGHTALHKAVQQKHRNICYMLVAAGASLTMRDANGLTPMMVAFQVEDNDLATYLESQEKMLRPEFVEDI